MKKLFFVPAFLLTFSFVNAQNVGINTTGAAPDAGAGLDISFTNKGLLVPRVSISNLSTIAPITGSSTESLLVYNTNSTTGTGFHYWDGSQWVRMSINGDAWDLTGNAGTNASTNFLGTTDNVALRFRTNNTNRFEISTDGRLRSFNNGSAALPTYSWSSDTDIGMFRATTNQLGFSTAGSERMRILNDGDVGIGVTAPLARLHVSYNLTTQGAVYGEITNAASGWPGGEFYNPNTSNGTGVLGTSFYGVYGQVTTGAGWAGYFAGDVGCTGTYFGSDERWKKNIAPIVDESTSALDKIKLLEPKKYNWKADEYPGMGFNSERTSYGFIAQDLEKVFPDLVVSKKIPNPKSEERVKESVDGYYMVDYVGLIPVLTQAIKEQQTTIESQNKKISDLEERIEKLERLIQE